MSQMKGLTAELAPAPILRGRERGSILQRSVVAHVTEGTDRVYNMLPRKVWQPK